jgi:hypothetical protein
MFRRSPKKSVRHWTLAAILWLVVLAFVFSPASVGVKADDGDDGGGFRHVFVIMMENTGFNTLIGNPNAPFTNYLAATAGLAINYFGVTHPSQPNYIAATSGSTNGVTGDGDVTINVATDLANDTVPDYSWISPDQCHDMHGRGGGGASDPCDFSQVQPLIAAGDLFLAQTVSSIVNSKAWRGNGDFHHVGQKRFHRYRSDVSQEPTENDSRAA